MQLPLKAPVSALQQPNDNLLIVDLRPAEDYDNGHIPGAIWLDARRLNRSEKPVVGLLPDTTAVNAIIADLGLKASQHIVAYDAGGATSAARFVWVLNAYGWNAVSWLDGGFAAWLATGGDQSLDSPNIDTSTAPALDYVGNNIIEKADLIFKLGSDSLSILDVRTRDEYEGTDVRSEFGGHMPGAVHYEWTDMLDKSLQLLDEKIIEQRLEELGVAKDNQVVVYCQSHQRSSMAYATLKSLGYNDVVALDGAWSNWGNDPATPKVVGGNPKDQD